MQMSVTVPSLIFTISHVLMISSLPFNIRASDTLGPAEAEPVLNIKIVACFLLSMKDLKQSVWKLIFSTGR